MIYGQKYSMPRNWHAVERLRQLFSLALGYEAPDTEPDYGLPQNKISEGSAQPKRIIFLHGTTWPSKHFPEHYWRKLAIEINASDYNVVIPWGNDVEKERAERIEAELIAGNLLKRPVGYFLAEKNAAHHLEISETGQIADALIPGDSVIVEADKANEEEHQR